MMFPYEVYIKIKSLAHISQTVNLDQYTSCNKILVEVRWREYYHAV